MKAPISIHSKNQEIYLSVGIYSIKVIGGWGVKINDFSVLLKKVEGDRIIESRPTLWKYQAYEFKQRAKKIFTLHVTHSGNYIVEFINPEQLKVKPSNSLFITSLFEKEIPNEKLEICIG